MRELWVWMGGRRVGTLDGTDRRSPRIDYEDEWATDPTATPLSTSMPLAGRSHAGRAVAAWLWGLLPDNERVLARWASRYQCSATDVVGLLAHVGSDVAGAAQFLPPGLTPDEAEPPTSTPVSVADIAAMLRDLRADATAWHPQLGGRWSLAGAQAKLALARDARSGAWSVPSGAAATTHILKPAIGGLDHHDLNEHLCLRTAEALGLAAAGSAVLRFEDETALVVTRYDRVHREGTPTRIHQEDLGQALGVLPTNKYESDGGPGALDVVGVLERVIVDRPRPAVEQFLRALVFNWLVLGTDGHAKNHSLLLSGPQVRLAPLYDLASATILGDHPRKLRLAQQVGSEYRPTIIAARHWARLGRDAGVGDEWLVDQARTTADAIGDAITTVASGEELDGDAAAFAARLVDGVTTWVEDCRRRLR